jgi:hypothetical protein
MESLESRLGCLTPEQRREVEDFVVFLLQKKNLQAAPAVSFPPPVMLNTPPVFTADPHPAPQIPPVPPQDLMIREESSSVPASTDHGPIIHEITVGNDDPLTHEYMDYGRFDSQPSPATEAVKKVKQKIIARQADEKPHHLLDWVD